jgi:predicted dehydrogenase
MSEPTAVTPKELGLPETMPLPKRKDWRLGLVGFGGIARMAHAPAYQSQGWRIVAVADPDPAAQKLARGKFGVGRAYGDYRELVEDAEVEIVDLLTQPTVREEVVRAAAETGKPLITEKPFGTTFEECLRMVETAERAGISLAVHQNYRWMTPNYLAHHIVRQGLIGAPFFASIEIFGQQDAALAGHPFYGKCEDFLTVQWNNHLVDLMRYWTGREAARTFACTRRMEGQNFASDNLLCAISDFGPGLTGHILHHELLRSSLGGVRCRIDGDKGSLDFNFWGASLLLESQVLGKGQRRLDLSALDYPDSFSGSMGDFLLAIEEGREPMVSGRRNLPTIRTVLAQEESAKAGGKWVSCE